MASQQSDRLHLQSSTLRTRGGLCVVSWFAASVYLLLLAGPFDGASGQLGAQEVIPDALECPACRLSLQVVARLGEVDGPGALPGPAFSVIVDSSGRYWATFASDILPMVFTGDGRFIREVGGLGEGPGEFRQPQFAAPAGDSVAIYDALGQRITLIAPDFGYVRDVLVRDVQPQGMLVLDWPGAVVLNGRGYSAETVGWSLFVTDASGGQASLRVPLGLDGGAFNPQFGRFHQRNLARSTEGGLWAVRRWNDYRMVKWSPGGNVLEHLVREAGWLPPGSDGLRGGPQTPPTPYIAAVHEDRAGLLWIIGHVARPDWRQPYVDIRARQGEPPRTSGGISEQPASFSPMLWQLYQTLIEIVDPVNKRVVWRETLNEWLVDVLADGRLVLYRETADHIPFMDVVTVALIRDR